MVVYHQAKWLLKKVTSISLVQIVDEKRELIEKLAGVILPYVNEEKLLEVVGEDIYQMLAKQDIKSTVTNQILCKKNSNK